MEDIINISLLPFHVQPDSNQIVGRLMQIRDYIKQATSMMERIQSSSDPVSTLQTVGHC